MKKLVPQRQKTAGQKLPNKLPPPLSQSFCTFAVTGTESRFAASAIPFHPFLDLVCLKMLMKVAVPL
jgi:hypothetical protein